MKIKELEQLSSMQLYNLTKGIVEVLKDREYKRSLQTPVVSPKTANQLRAELIQRAREFVEEQKDQKHNGYKFESKNGREFLCDAKFVHNSAKRTTTCILIGISTGYSRKKVTVRCHPNEVFNEAIGEVISLCKALQIDIPQEFMEAVQPNEVVAGMIVDTYTDNEPFLVVNVAKVTDGNRMYDDLTTTMFTRYEPDMDGDKIIDDTNAEYEVSK